jgi:hypothetical protein
MSRRYPVGQIKMTTVGDPVSGRARFPAPHWSRLPGDMPYCLDPRTLKGPGAGDFGGRLWRTVSA